MVVWASRMVLSWPHFGGSSRIYSAVNPWTAFSASAVAWLGRIHSVAPADLEGSPEEVGRAAVAHCGDKATSGRGTEEYSAAWALLEATILAPRPGSTHFFFFTIVFVFIFYHNDYIYEIQFKNFTVYCIGYYYYGDPWLLLKAMCRGGVFFFKNNCFHWVLNTLGRKAGKRCSKQSRAHEKALSQGWAWDVRATQQ